MHRFQASEKDASMGEPQYRLEGIVHTKAEIMEDFEGPLDVIFELLSKNKIEIQDVSITAILEQYLAYLDETIWSNAADC